MFFDRSIDRSIIVHVHVHKLKVVVVVVVVVIMSFYMRLNKQQHLRHESLTTTNNQQPTKPTN